MTFSVIIPVYNAEKYLKNCIQSILAQSCQDFEIILVDDGSADASWEIAHDLDQRLEQLTCIRSEHRGTGAARNIGLSHAGGDYILFMDADDYWLDEHLLATRKAKIALHQTDVFMYQMLKVSEEGKVLEKFRKAPFFHDQMVLGLKDVYQDLVSNGQVLASCCNKCMRRDLLTQHGISFLEDVYAEDIDWVIQLFSYAQTICLLNIDAYAYTQHKTPSRSNIRLAPNDIVILGQVMLTYPQLFPLQLVQGMRSECFREIAEYARKASLMDDQVRIMNEQGIDHLLFKGYVLRNYYSVPELRTFGDVDFVIRKEDREKSHALMLEQGFLPHYDWEPVYDYLRGEECYEIHTDVMEIDVSDKADYVSYFSHIWEHVICPDPEGKPHSFEFTPEFHLIYLLTHIAKHISTSGAGIRLYLDIAIFLQHFGDSLDWHWIQGEFSALKFEDFANMTFTAVEQWFGITAPFALRPISPEVMEDFLNFTLEGGVFGKAARDRSTVMLKQNDRSNDQQVSKGKTLLFHIFPPVSSLSGRYGFLEKHPWMLPIAWARRVFDNRASWSRYVDSAKGIVNADTDEVLRLKKLYKEIGL